MAKKEPGLEDVTELPVAPDDIAQAQTEEVEDDVAVRNDGPGSVREVGENFWAFDNDTRIEDRNGNSLLHPAASTTRTVRGEDES